MRTIGNILWFILGGIIMGLGWWLAGVIAFITIIGIPWARSCFVIGLFSFFPFGKEAIARDELTQKEDVGTGPLGCLGNVLWFILFGWWLALGHLISAAALILTIIGIPFAIQHIKLAALALSPVGQTVVPIEVAAAARQQQAAETVNKLRRK